MPSKQEVEIQKAVDKWLKGHEDETKVFFLPSYSPELNLGEYLNCDFKEGVPEKNGPKEKNNFSLTEASKNAWPGLKLFQIFQNKTCCMRGRYLIAGLIFSM